MDGGFYVLFCSLSLFLFMRGHWQEEDEMKIPEEWPTQQMLSAAYKINRADYGAEIYYVDACVKAALTAAATAPAQEDEPVAYLVNKCGRETLSFYPLKDKYEHTPLYTRPADDKPNYQHEYTKAMARILCMKADHDKLRNAAEEAVWYIGLDIHPTPRGKKVLENLRAALGKPIPSDTDKQSPG